MQDTRSVRGVLVNAASCCITGHVLIDKVKACMLKNHSITVFWYFFSHKQYLFGIMRGLLWQLATWILSILWDWLFSGITSLYRPLSVQSHLTLRIHWLGSRKSSCCKDRLAFTFWKEGCRAMCCLKFFFSNEWDWEHQKYPASEL